MPAVAGVRLPVPDFTPGHVHDLTRRILAEPQFRQPAKPLLTRFGDWLSNEIGKLLNDLASGGNAGLLAWTIVAIAVAVAALLLSRFARRVRRDPGIPAEAVQTARRRTASDWKALATSHRDAGEWKEAVRCEYRALIATLSETNILDEVPGRTAREYQRLINSNLPAAEGEFGEATNLFEAVWYGDLDTGSEEELQLRELSKRVLQSAGHR